MALKGITKQGLILCGFFWLNLFYHFLLLDLDQFEASKIQEQVEKKAKYFVEFLKNSQLFTTKIGLSSKKHCLTSMAEQSFFCHLKDITKSLFFKFDVNKKTQHILTNIYLDCNSYKI